MAPGAVGNTARNIACHEQIATPLLTKKQVSAGGLRLLSSTVSGDGEIFYEDKPGAIERKNVKDVITVIKNHADHSVGDYFPKGISIDNAPKYRSEIDEILLRCDESKLAFAQTEFWNSSNELVRLSVATSITFSEFKEFSPFAVLQSIVCNKNYAGIGVQIVPDGEFIKVTEVFKGLSADKAGVLVDDIITGIDHKTLSGLTPEQVLEKIRGPVNSTVALTISRKGQVQPVEITVRRGSVPVQTTQQGR